MMKLHWDRTPLALRVGLLLVIASNLLRVVLAVALSREDMYMGRLWAVSSALYAAGDVMCLVGAVELARRSPRATLLVWAYAMSVAMFAVWVVVQMIVVRWSGGSLFSIFDKLQWVEGALTLFVIVAWALLGGNAGWITVLVIGKLIAGIQPISDVLWRVVHVSSDSTKLAAHSLLQIAASVAALLLAMGLPFARPLVPRIARGGLFEMMAIAIAIAGACHVMLELDVLGHGVHVPLVLGVIASLAWFVVSAARSRTGGEPGAWAMTFAVAAWAAIALGRVEQLPSLIDEVASEHLHGPDPTLVLSLMAVGGLVLVLASLTQIARARGAEQALRIASACALVVVVAGGASLGASWSDTPMPAILRIGGMAVAYAACAFGLRTVGASLGTSELPTATLRSA